MNNQIDCWHFAAATLRDGTPLPAAGVALPEIATPVPCERGYHGSVRAIDALSYAPGPWVARVRLSGVVTAHGDPTDKHVASQRVGLVDYMDVSQVLREFARACALDVIHRWDAPEVVVRHLRTGDESIRDAARAAAEAARAAAWDAALAAAARAAAWDAAWAAAMDSQNARLEQMLYAALGAVMQPGGGA